MKPAGMVASSPGRAEKLPAPSLARLLRGKRGSRSQARGRPMFVSRSRSVGRCSSSLEPAVGEGGEPSSPKVTCIGQVRIRKKNRNQSSTKKNSPKSNRCDPSLRCRRCLERALLCKFFTRRIKKKPCWFCFCRPYRFFFCWKSKQKVEEEEEEEATVGEAPPRPAFVGEIKVETEAEDEDEEETRVFVSSSSAGGVNDAQPTTHSPPKNALLLMRCRSAPHNRSSAPALCRFPVSPTPGSESEEEEAKGEGIEESCNLSSKDEEESRCSSTSRQQSPAGLMRCKSEPAKKAERLMEVTYSKKLTGSGSGGEGLGMVREVGPTPSPPPILLRLHREQ